MSVIAQAGAVVVRLDRDQPEYLLVTARRNPGNWIFPKGHIEAGESHEDAALREAEEEAGVSGRAIGRAGTLDFERDALSYEVTYFVVVTGDEGESSEGRRLAWLRFDDAIARLEFDNARDVLTAAHLIVTKREAGP